MKIIIANNFKDKLLGLMGKSDIDYGLLIINCKSIHTYFMKINIDVLLLDQNNRILMINKNVSKNKILVFNTKEKQTSILELPSNYKYNLSVGDIININNFKSYLEH